MNSYSHDYNLYCNAAQCFSYYIHFLSLCVRCILLPDDYFLDMCKIGEDVVSSNAPNAEYVHLIQDLNVWFIDYIIGVAFRTPVHFADKMHTELV